MRLLTLKLDFTFKKLFAENPDLLANLLNAVLHHPATSRIVSVTVKNPQILATELTGKYITLDILAVTAAGSQYNIEMQTRKYAVYPQRILYYLSKLYANQLQESEDYSLLQPVIGIHFLDYSQYPQYKQTFHFCFDCRERQHSDLRLSDHWSLHLLELPKFERLLAQIPHDELSEWLHFFNHAPEEEEQTMRTYYQTPALQKAFDVLERLSADDTTRRLAEVRERALRDELTLLREARQEGLEQGLEQGRQQGLEQGRQQGLEQGLAQGRQETIRITAQQLLALGLLTVEQIAQVTGLSVAEIQP